MNTRSLLRDYLGPWIRRHPGVKRSLVKADIHLDLVRHSVAQFVPAIIHPQPRNLTIAVTAYCNLRCTGCRYGRDFMPGAQLSWPMARDLLSDAKQTGFEAVRLYGGEPLLHPDLARMVEHALRLGLRVYVTTNGILLEEKIDELYQAGLRDFTIGFYGVGAHYNSYVQRKDRFSRLE